MTDSLQLLIGIAAVLVGFGIAAALIIWACKEDE